MRNRVLAVVSAIAVVLTIGGASLAANGSTPVAVTEEHEIVAADAGTVVIQVADSNLTIVDVQAQDGWTAEVEIATGREVEMDFRSGELRVQVNAELEDGELQVRIRERNADGDVAETTVTTVVADPTTSTTIATNDTTSTSLPDDDDTTTSTTIPDDDDTTTSTTIPDDDDLVSLEPFEKTFAIEDIGTVTIAWDGTTLTLVAYDFDPAWTAEFDLRSDEIEIELSSGDDEAEFEAEISDGELRIEIERG